ncbi:MAG: nucleoside kinase [Lachnospiraceae bacterium]|nr:nucleoside kinase [Lachnospiraceae bacterium]
MLKITYKGKEYQYEDGCTFLDMLPDMEPEAGREIVLAKFRGKLIELFKIPMGDGEVEFITTHTVNGRRTYRRSLVFLMERALFDVAAGKDVRVMYSLADSYFCRFTDDSEVTEEMVEALKLRMLELVEEDIPLKKSTMKTYEAMGHFEKEGMPDKKRLLRYRSSSNINIYELDGCYDYFYGFMVPSTGYLKVFDVKLFEDGFVLIYPDKKDPSSIKRFTPSMQLSVTLRKSTEWGRLMDIPTVGALNDAIARGRTREVVLTQEALMEERIGALAREISSDSHRKFVMIAGPSSSGKTTFSHRLSTQLMARGLHPHPVPLDDFYLDHDLMPVDEFGERDFEAIECLNIELFNDCMSRLLNGEEVILPRFNFKSGKSEWHDHPMKIGEGDVLVIEGIHGLNDRMSYSLPDESKFKIYISALTQLAVDEHNPLSTSDGRLIRRIVRDARTRGTSAAGTIAMWPSVRRGEEKNIFPFQDHADATFNSALIYELAVLKIYAYPQLCDIEPGEPEYDEANRLLKLMDYVLPMATDDIANNSLIREFIGGSCFNV